ncbi:MAG TPA: MlaD family protein [Jatrophihabitans sp.]|nr:MlaD family protein [Jatrophihabitans sp.]
MLSRRVRIQAVVFVVAGLLAMTYTAVRYVGFLRLFGVGVYTVHLELPVTGGIFPNAEVDYRGVPVGRVGDVTLTATGVQAQLLLDSGAPRIPADVRAVVTDRSVVGEQYVDLRPGSDTGPYLEDGSVIGRGQAAVPASANALLTSVDGLLRSVPIGSVRTVVGELDTAFAGSADNIRRLIGTSKAFITAAAAHYPQTAALIDTSATALRTQQQTSSSIREFSAHLRLIAGQLASSDGDVRALLRATPPAARTAAGLIRDVGTPLGVTISNLLSTAQIARANVRGVQELLIQMPRAVSLGNSVVGPDGARVGLTLTFFDPLPCTQGYAGTVRRRGLDTGPGQPLNTSAGCTDTSSRADLHGSQHVPFNAGAVPPWLSSYDNGPVGVTPVTSLGQLMGS